MKLSYYLTRPEYLWRDLTNPVKWAWQRLTRGWDDRVIWSIDLYLAEVMPAWLRKLRADKQGVPGVFFDDFTKTETDAEMEAASAKWDRVLIEMIVGFEAAARLINLDYSDAVFNSASRDEVMDADKRRADRALELLREYFFDLFD